VGRNQTSFQPGNPGGGRKALPLDVVQACRQFTPQNIAKLQEIVNHPNEKSDPAIMGVQVRAAEALLNRAWGSAPQVVQLQGDTTIRILTPRTKALPVSNTSG
jgi:hypothetical protein